MDYILKTNSHGHVCEMNLYRNGNLKDKISCKKHQQAEYICKINSEPTLKSALQVEFGSTTPQASDISLIFM